MRPTRQCGRCIARQRRSTRCSDSTIPDNTALAVACESLLRQGPDLTIGPGLAESAEFTSDTSLVVTLRSDVTFWDGTPLTPADVVFSLKRQQDPANGGFYSAMFAKVTDIAATGDTRGDDHHDRA